MLTSNPSPHYWFFCLHSYFLNLIFLNLTIWTLGKVSQPYSCDCFSLCVFSDIEIMISLMGDFWLALIPNYYSGLLRMSLSLISSPYPNPSIYFFIHSFTIYLLSPCHVSSTWLPLNCSRINVSAWLWSYCLFVQKSLLQMISRFLGLAFQVFVDVCCLSCPASIHPVPPSLPGELDFPHRLSGCDPGEANPAFTPGLDTSSKPKPIRTMCSLLPRLTW